MALQPLVRSDGKGGYLPVLVESWTLAPDRSAYTFHLRKGVKFHDGTDFNAQAVKWNLERVLALPVDILAEVESIDVIDDSTVRLNLDHWDRLILAQLTFNTGFMISPTAFEKNGEEWVQTHPVGTGPFKLKEFKRSEVVKYEKFDDYWEKGAPYLDEIHYILILDSMTSMAALLAGEIDVSMSAAVETGAELKDYPRFEIYSNYVLHTGLYPKTNDPNGLWYDKRLRQALEYAIDKEAINRAMGLGYTNAIYEILPAAPGHPSIPNRTYNPEKAKELLAEAGYPDGFKTAMIMTKNYPKDVAVAIQAYLADVGIDMEVEAYARSTFIQYQYQGGEGDRFIWKPQTCGTDPLFNAYNYWRTDSGFAINTARPPGFDDVIQKAIVAEDQDEMSRLLEEVETIGYEEAIMIPLVTRPSINIVSDNLKGQRMFVGGENWCDFSKAWLTKK
jgi:ABC-type transport system substrate-binding protein